MVALSVLIFRFMIHAKKEKKYTCLVLFKTYTYDNLSCMFQFIIGKLQFKKGCMIYLGFLYKIPA